MAYTTIDDGSEYFHTQLYTGDAQSSKVITNDANAGDFKPDWLWIKERSSTSSHLLFDSTRGTNKKLTSNSTDSEETFAYLSSYDTNGFTIGTSDGAINDSQTYVAWQWKANGGTTTTNDASATSVGTIDSVYQANTTAGFSIVTYTGTGSAGSVAHGLGSAPKVVICKMRSGTGEWITWHTGIDIQAKLSLNTTDALYNPSSNIYWNGTLPSSTVFSIGTSGSLNANGSTYVAYCFSEVKGYSKFGYYRGNGNADGTFVYLGFKPKFVIGKSSSRVDAWFMHDTTRSTFNPVDDRLMPHLNYAEGAEFDIDFLSNGYKILDSEAQINGNGETYVYLAFAENPFVSSKGVPTTAR